MASETVEEAGASGGVLANLNDRERKLVGLMLVNFAVLVLAGSIYAFNNALSETRDEIERYEQTLDALGEYGPKYLAAQQAGESQDEDAKRFSGERLKKNKLQLTSFVAEAAAAADIKVDNYDEDQLPLTSSKNDTGPIIMENQLRVDIREAEMTALLRMLERLEKSKEPVVIKRINLREVRKKKGMVRANITISTYTQQDQEG